MRSPIWFYLFWVLFISVASYLLAPHLISQNDGKIDFNNTFLDLENKLKSENEKTTETIENTINNLSSSIDENPKLKLPLLNGIKELKNITNIFCEKIDNYKIALTAAALIKDKEIISDKERFSKIVSNSSIDTINFEGKELYRWNNGKIEISKEKELTTYLMIDLGYGKELEKLITETRREFITEYAKTLAACQSAAKLSDEDFFKRIKNIEDKLFLKIDTSWINNSDKNTWAEANFDHMPYAACMPIFEKFKSDAKAGQALMTNDLSKLIENKIATEFDKIFPLVNAKSCQIKKGDIFEAQVALGALSSSLTKQSSITVNGIRVSINKDGIGTYKETCNNTGNKTLKIEAIVIHPVTGEKMSTNSTFEYTVAE